MSGVGFGGVFASLLALDVHRLNKEKELYGENDYINLKGLFVANGMVDFRFDPSTHTIDMMYQYSIIPQSLYDRYKEKECHIRWEYIWLIASQLEYKPNDDCSTIWFEAKNHLGKFITIYDLLDNRKPVPIIVPKQNNMSAPKDLDEPYEPGMPDEIMNSMHLSQRNALPTSVNEYLNFPDVRSKLHVSSGVRNYTTRSFVYSNFEPSIEGCGWAYDILLKLGYKILHIVGNTDGEVTVPGMWKWLKDRKIAVTQPWSAYMTPTGEPFGF